MTFYNGSIEMGLGSQAADFYVVKYYWSTGSGLVTKFRMTTPLPSDFLGEANASDQLPVGNQYALQWSGDVVLSPGQEEILFRRSAFTAVYPNATSAVFEVRSVYFAAPGSGPVVISVQSYVGGTMVLSNFNWSNVGYTSTRTDYPTFSKVITDGFNGNDPFDPGEFMTNLKIDFISGVVSYV